MAELREAFCDNCRDHVTVGSRIADWIEVRMPSMIRRAPETGIYCDVECLSAHLQDAYLPPEERAERFVTEVTA